MHTTKQPGDLLPGSPNRSIPFPQNLLTTHSTIPSKFQLRLATSFVLTPSDHHHSRTTYHRQLLIWLAITFPFRLFQLRLHFYLSSSSPTIATTGHPITTSVLFMLYIYQLISLHAFTTHIAFSNALSGNMPCMNCSKERQMPFRAASHARPHVRAG